MRHLMHVVPVALVATVAAALPAAAGAAPAGAAAQEFEGTVVSVDRPSRSFRLRDTERGTVRIRVTRSTRFERVAGLSGLRAGMTNIESVVRRSGGRWIALEVERSGGGGEHGGDDDGGRGPGGED
jgi:hypothetical protein